MKKIYLLAMMSLVPITALSAFAGEPAWKICKGKERAAGICELSADQERQERQALIEENNSECAATLARGAKPGLCEPVDEPSSPAPDDSGD